MSPHVNHRAPGETFAAYRARRRASNKAVRLHLKGRLAYTATTPVTLPVLGVDAQVDRAVLAGQYRDLVLVTLPNSTQVRIGRTKGISFRYPVPRAEARRAALDARRAARA